METFILQVVDFEDQFEYATLIYHNVDEYNIQYY